MSSRHSQAHPADVLLEHEAGALLQSLGINVPEHIAFAIDPDAALPPVDVAASEACSRFQGNRVVLKIASAAVLHKSDVGGVAVVAKERTSIIEAAERMAAMTGVGTLVLSEFVQHDSDLGGELLLGIRYTIDFGPVVTLGIGGVATEFLASSLKPGREIAVFSPGLTKPADIEAVLSTKAFTAFLTGAIRNQPAKATAAQLRTLIASALDFAAAHVPHEIEELEINPLVPTSRGFYALDAVVRVGSPALPAAAARPFEKIACLLHPRSAAVMGVSQNRNAGRVILDNLLDAGMDRDLVFVIKPNHRELAGCACVADVSSLPMRVDLLVLAVPAEQVAKAVDDAVAFDRAESIIVIPGGTGEHESSTAIAESLRTSIATSRRSPSGGLVVNGGNCLGIQSRPGRVNTIFLPARKVDNGATHEEPLAIISQSGALAVAVAAKLAPAAPRYLVSIGNQIDLTVGDYLQYLTRDPSIHTAAFYVEGFQPLDGRHWLEAAASMTSAGRRVVLYRGGRTAAGAKATSTHTAAIAGDAVVSRELARAAGVLVADTLEEFEDFTRAATMLRGRVARRSDTGKVGVALMSNAGFETVALADNLSPLVLTTLSEATRERVRDIVEARRLDRIVTVENPLDVNPMLDDSGFAGIAAAAIADAGTGAAVIACIPFTGALRTLKDEIGEGSIVQELQDLWRLTTKPWVCAVDGGPLYEPMRRALTSAGIPVFPTADRAIKALAACIG